MKVRRVSITNKLIIGIIILFLITTAALGIVSYNKSRQMLIDQIKSNTESVASSIAVTINGETVATVQPGDETVSEEYLEVSRLLTVFTERTGMEYVYTIRPGASETGMEYSVDAQIEDMAMIGDVFEDEEAVPALKGETVSSSEPYTDDWGTHISAYSPIYQGQNVVGAVGVDVSMEWIQKQTSELLRTIIILCLVVLAAGGVVLFILSRTLKRKFVMLNDKIAELANGEGDLTKHVEINSGDEFEVIGENINKLIEFIRGVLLSIRAGSDKLSKASADIADNVKTTRSDAESVSNTMTDLSSIMQESSASLNEMSQRMNEITVSFNDIVEEIEGGRKFSHDVKDAAFVTGENARKESSETEEKVAAMERSVTEKIERSQAVSRIEDLTADIIGISDQTNLLALNASIEAARAGEAGRGFSVVASEIGQLASNSQSAASEIQTVSSEVISAVNELAEEARKLIHFVNETTMEGYSNLVKISEEYQHSAERIDEMMERFATASAQIRANIDHIQTTTGSVNVAVDNAAKGISETAEKTVEMSANISSIDEDAGASSEISGELETEVGKFRLE